MGGRGRPAGGEQRGLRCRWKVAADLGEQSNSDRKFLYGVRLAAHSQLEARNRLVFANRARLTPSTPRAAGRYLEGRALSQFSATLPGISVSGISTFTASPGTQSSAGAACGRCASAVSTSIASFVPRARLCVLSVT